MLAVNIASRTYDHKKFYLEKKQLFKMINCTNINALGHITGTHRGDRDGMLKQSSFLPQLAGLPHFQNGCKRFSS